MREENVNYIVNAVKFYKESRNLEDILKIIVGYSRLGFYGEVKKRIEEFIEKGGDLGDLMTISNDLPEEMKEIITPVEIDMNGDFDADSFLEMGELLWEIGSPDEAKDNYIKAFEYYSLLGNREAAQRVLKILKENYPTDIKVSNLSFEAKQDDFIPKLKAYVTKPPTDEIDLRYALGKAFHGEGLLAEAEANYRRILELDRFHNSRRLLVALLREQGSFGDSLTLARELQGVDKLEEMYSIFESLRSAGKSKIGEDVLKEIYGIDPNFKDVKQLLGLLSKEVKVEERVEEVSTEVFIDREKKAEVGDESKRDKGFEEKKIVFL